MKIWTWLKNLFTRKPKPSQFGSSYDFHAEHWIEDDRPYPASVQGISSESIKIKNSSFSGTTGNPSTERYIPKEQRKPAVVPASRQTPVRRYGESECSHNYGARIGGVTTSSLRPDGNFAEGVLTGYLANEALEAIGNMISEDRSPSFSETRSAPEPTWQEPARVTETTHVWQEPARAVEPATSSWNDSGTTNWGDSGSTKIDGGSSWGSDISDAVSSVFSD